VEYVANLSIDPATIITSAGMSVAVTGGQNAVTELTADATGNGKIIIRVPRAAGEKAFIFETSTDGVNYSKTGSSSLTKIELSGFTPATTVHVRYYAISKTGDSAISQSKSVIVT
jgi:hypothetical protein